MHQILLMSVIKIYIIYISSVHVAFLCQTEISLQEKLLSKKQ